jgi:hypothetical protein
MYGHVAGMDVGIQDPCCLADLFMSTLNCRVCGCVRETLFACRPI